MRIRGSRISCSQLLLCNLILLGRVWQAQAEAASETFTCDDGSKIPLEMMCDGRPHCPDSSDETLKSCLRVVCPAGRSFKCTYGACVHSEARCNGYRNCIDASDEMFGDDGSECADSQFRCSNSSECLPFSLICDGVEDCADRSDESEQLCRELFCSEQDFRCAYGGCAPRELLCDGTHDCADGSDESSELCGNATSPECRCTSGRQCIPTSQLCDGAYQCRDASDETSRACGDHQCAEGQFRCTYGGCVAAERRCDGIPNCRDWSDEEDCSATPNRRSWATPGGCLLSRARPAGLVYRVLEPDCGRCRPGQVLPERTRLEFACAEPTANAMSLLPKVVECRAGKWQPPPPPTPASCPRPDARDVVHGEGLRRCPPLDSEGTLRRCQLAGQIRWRSCEGAVPVGTRVRLRCRRFHQRVRGSARITCLEDGSWTRAALRCEPVCGVRTAPASAIPLIVGGWEPDGVKSALPWHATLFARERGDWHFLCGGTLISDRYVLTAAHCTWETEPEDWLVVLAGRSSNFSERGPAAQARHLSSIETQTSYQHDEGNYNSDLALLLLSEAAHVDGYVMPACIDWADERDVSERVGQVGIVAGMGVTENDRHSASLRLVSAQVVSQENCRENEEPNFRKYLAYTSFCAGWANGTGACNGDSGGGFLLRRPDSDVWEIHGIVSLSPRRKGASSLCDLNYYTVFTKLSAYLNWIKKVIKAHSVAEDPSDDDDPIAQLE